MQLYAFLILTSVYKKKRQSTKEIQQEGGWKNSKDIQCSLEKQPNNSSAGLQFVKYHIIKSAGCRKMFYRQSETKQTPKGPASRKEH